MVPEDAGAGRKRTILAIDSIGALIAGGLTPLPGNPGLPVDYSLTIFRTTRPSGPVTVSR